MKGGIQLPECTEYSCESHTALKSLSPSATSEKRKRTRDPSKGFRYCTTSASSGGRSAPRVVVTPPAPVHAEEEEDEEEDEEDEEEDEEEDDDDDDDEEDDEEEEEKAEAPPSPPFSPACPPCNRCAVTSTVSPLRWSLSCCTLPNIMPMNVSTWPRATRSVV